MIHPFFTLELLFGTMTLLWPISVALKDVSIVDIFWGAGFCAHRMDAGDPNADA